MVGVPVNSMVPVFAVKVPVEPVISGILRVLDPPCSVPLLLVQFPVKVCTRPAPRFRVPPSPLVVRDPPLTFPVRVAVPAVFIMVTVPVVVKSSIFWAAVVPSMITVELPAVKVPELIKSPSKVNPKLEVARLAPAVMVNGTLVFVPNCLAPLRVMIPVPNIVTPPVPGKVAGHSVETVRLETPALYCSPPEAP